MFHINSNYYAKYFYNKDIFILYQSQQPKVNKYCYQPRSIIEDYITLDKTIRVISSSYEFHIKQLIVTGRDNTDEDIFH